MADVNTDQMLPFVLAPLKADGTPAVIDDTSVVYASSDETVMRVQDLAVDNLSGNVFPVAVGTARVSVTFDADIGAGVSLITGVSEDVNVTLGPSAPATHFTFTFGPAIPKVTGP